MDTTVSYVILAMLASSKLARRMGLRASILAGFVLVGLFSGVPAAVAWPLEACIHYNIPGVLLGDDIHGLAIEYMGNPQSPHAGITVPRPLRLPQAIILGSLLA